MPEVKKVEYEHYQAGNLTPVQGEVIVERPVSMYVNGQSWLTFMCTPVDLDALVVGFLFTEGVLVKRADLLDVIVHPKGHIVEVFLDKEVTKPENWRFTSGCAGGVVSADKTIEKVPLKTGWISSQEIVEISTSLLEHQGLYDRVGGVHTSVLFDRTTAIIVSEDIGRHNTIDKLAGKMFLDQVSGKDKILATSGRISSEMLQKAASMGVSVVISRTSPTSMSIQLAEEYQITLVGYARGKKFNVYSHVNQITKDI